MLTPSTARRAEISRCLRYRYLLSRRWGSGPDLLFVMLNPSTADAQVDDQTVRRCAGFARREGLDGLRIVNLYAFRSTDPSALWSSTDPVGPDNDFWLERELAAARAAGAPVVAAWGMNAPARRAREVLTMVPGTDWRCLGTTRGGMPRHPSRVASDQALVPLLPVQVVPEGG